MVEQALGGRNNLLPMESCNPGLHLMLNLWNVLIINYGNVHNSAVMSCQCDNLTDFTIVMITYCQLKQATTCCELLMFLPLYMYKPVRNT